MIEYSDLKRLMIELNSSSWDIDKWMEENNINEASFDEFAVTLVASGINIARLVLIGDEETITDLRNQGNAVDDVDPTDPQDVVELMRAAMVAVTRSSFTLGWEAHKQLGGARG